MNNNTPIKTLGIALQENVILAPYTSFGIGGPARYFITAQTPTEIIRAIRAARKNDIKYFILGGGSNILIDDQGFDGMIIKDECRHFQFDSTGAAAQSGALVDSMVDVAVERSLGGLEYAAGIRGTIGGAVYGNAGAFGHAINEILEKGVIYNHEDKIVIVDNNYFKFAYRKSLLSDCGDVVLSVYLRLNPADQNKLAEIVNERRKFRQDRHPVGLGSAGSVFKNLRTLEDPKNVIPAGKLLEEAGVKDMRIGDAAIFDKHCNIVVNMGHATSSDVKTLIGNMNKAVLDKFGVDLKREILYIGP